VNGLAQTLLKLTAPGVPDFYQGTEFWDLSLVDPDNRRPVDFERCCACLGKAAPVAALTHWRDGTVKQAMIARVLALRRAAPMLFAEGSYQPVATGSDHLLAFLRQHQDQAMLVVVPRLPTRLLREPSMPLLDAVKLADMAPELPPGPRWHDVLADTAPDDVALHTLLARFPVCLLSTRAI
jgi:(1->4)-alpha-D-glucan 1-alpha-D-glucosylmutase